MNDTYMWFAPPAVAAALGIDHSRVNIMGGERPPSLLELAEDLLDEMARRGTVVANPPFVGDAAGQESSGLT